MVGQIAAFLFAALRQADMLRIGNVRKYENGVFLAIWPIGTPVA